MSLIFFLVGLRSPLSLLPIGFLFFRHWGQTLLDIDQCRTGWIGLRHDLLRFVINFRRDERVDQHIIIGSLLLVLLTLANESSKATNLRLARSFLIRIFDLVLLLVVLSLLDVYQPLRNC